jgi:adenylosuccinate synthase
MNRIGIRVQDLFDESILRQKVTAALGFKNQVLSKIYNRTGAKVEDVVQELLSYVERLRPYVADTALELSQAIDNGKVVLCEAGQATLLDVDHGTYPFVTSSNATAGGACTGSGIPPTRIDRVVAVLKAFTTRVGEGPFPTELHDKFGDYLREVGHEYGTTTGRPRRIGWLDLVIGRYAQRINGVTDFAITKLDNYDGLDEIPVCVAYEVNGVRHDEMPVNQTDFHHAVPIFETLPGWKQDISGCRKFEDLPQEAQDFVEYVEARIGARISIVGVGPGREAVIERHSVLGAV